MNSLQTNLLGMKVNVTLGEHLKEEGIIVCAYIVDGVRTFDILLMSGDVTSYNYYGFELHPDSIASLRQAATTRFSVPVVDENDPDGHDGDCTIYAVLSNGLPTDGICTCGFGWRQVRKGDCSYMYSKELLTSRRSRSTAERSTHIGRAAEDRELEDDYVFYVGKGECTLSLADVKKEFAAYKVKDEGGGEISIRCRPELADEVCKKIEELGCWIRLSVNPAIGESDGH